MGILESTSKPPFYLLRLNRLMRLARIIRVVRGLYYFSELRLMVAQIGQSFRMLISALVLVFTVTLIAALIIMDDVAEWSRTEGWHSKDQVDHLYRQMGSIPDLFLQLVSTVTGGQDWLDFYYGVLISDLGRVVFLVYII